MFYKNHSNLLKLTLSSIICGLSFVLIYFGAVTNILSWTMLLIASILSVFAVIEIGGVYPWLIWAVTSALCLLFLPDKTVALEYALFAGIYPMVKTLFEKFAIITQWIFKILFFVVILFAGYFLISYVFGLEADFSLGALYLAGGTAVASFYDIVLTLLISIYMVKIRKRIKIEKLGLQNDKKK